MYMSIENRRDNSRLVTVICADEAQLKPDLVVDADGARHTKQGSGYFDVRER
jgi:2-polyprenyl-6-methoxyphenol hydroxylase-like FAD-dependent oxidoreductase